MEKRVALLLGGRLLRTFRLAAGLRFTFRTLAFLRAATLFNILLKAGRARGAALLRRAAGVETLGSVPGLGSTGTNWSAEAAESQTAP